ncbi:hypothetical protein MKEN_00160100 [Mycena kentingensis (nom. inval.)]|nr:hypothetical protein MKEN_00160100 [Mycena kentingensis (nom. inval.)]
MLQAVRDHFSSFLLWREHRRLAQYPPPLNAALSPVPSSLKMPTSALSKGPRRHAARRVSMSPTPSQTLAGFSFGAGACRDKERPSLAQLADLPVELILAIVDDLLLDDLCALAAAWLQFDFYFAQKIEAGIEAYIEASAGNHILALEQAAKENTPAILRAVLFRTPHYNLPETFTDALVRELFHIAVLEKSPRVAKLLLTEFGANPLDKCPLNVRMQAIHVAADQGDLETMRVLLDHNPTSIEGLRMYPSGTSHTPLGIAAHKGHLPVVQYLVSRGANISYAGDNFGIVLTALRCAVYGGHVDVARFLLENGATVPDERGLPMRRHLVPLQYRIPFCRSYKTACRLVLHQSLLFVATGFDEYMDDPNIDCKLDDFVMTENRYELTRLLIQHGMGHTYLMRLMLRNLDYYYWDRMWQSLTEDGLGLFDFEDMKPDILFSTLYRDHPLLPLKKYLPF